MGLFKQYARCGFAEETAENALKILGAVSHGLTSANDLTRLPEICRSLDLLGRVWTVFEARQVAGLSSELYHMPHHDVLAEALRESAIVEGSQDLLAYFCSKIAIALLCDVYSQAQSRLDDIEASIDYWRDEAVWPVWATVSQLPVRALGNVQAADWTLLQAKAPTALLLPSALISQEKTYMQVCLAAQKRALKGERTQRCSTLGFVAIEWLNGVSAAKTPIEILSLHVALAECVVNNGTELAPSTSDIQELRQRLEQLPKLATEADDQSATSLQPLKPPPWLARNWLKLALGTTAVVMATRTYSIQRDTLRQIGEDAVLLSRRLLNDWIALPLKGIWHTIKYEPEQGFLDSSRALQADVDALHRMMEDFVRSQPSSGQAQSVIDAIMHSYEQDVRAPIKSMLFGTMLQNVLIQIQQQKVEMQRTMTVLDKLMRSNELNFQILAAFPVVLVVTWVVRNAFGLVMQSRGLYSASLLREFRNEMRNLQRTLMKMSAVDTEDKAIKFALNGRVLTYTNHLRSLAHRLSHQDSRLFLADLRDIETATSEKSERTRHDIITRMYRSHPFLLP